MDDDAATLLAHTHATLVRLLPEIAGHHFEGLQGAARYKSLEGSCVIWTLPSTGLDTSLP